MNKRFLNDDADAEPAKVAVTKEAASLQRLLPATAKLKSIEFSVMTSEDIKKLSVQEICESRLYDAVPNREPVKFGVLDRALGTSEKKHSCTTCGQQLQACLGHFGHIESPLPMFSNGYFKACLQILQSICKQCSHVLIPPAARATFIKQLRHPRTDRRTRLAIFKKIQVQAKKTMTCPDCGYQNGPVKRIPGVFKIIHDFGKDAAGRESFYESINTSVVNNKTVKEYASKATRDLNALAAYRLLSGIPSDQCELLGLPPDKFRPENLLFTRVPVPPSCIRPTVVMNASGTNEDDLSIQLVQIVMATNNMATDLSKGSSINQLSEHWEHLHIHHAAYLNSDLPGFPKTNKGDSKGRLGITQRLKGKQGRFRGNLSGKRVDYSSRTVISPDPNLRIDEVGVPSRVAMKLTFPERVNAHNIERLRQHVRNGPEQHPGAVQIEHANGNKFSLKFAQRDMMASRLRIGDTVERHLVDGDIVLFNRQPSLHRMSIMAHKAKIMPWRTFRFNECVCTPYNADFDGDEMNLHVPQTYEARAEAMLLMGVLYNQVTPRHGEPLIAAIQDFLTAAYLLTQRDTFFDRASFCRTCAMMGDGREHIVIPPPAILKPVPLWTGKQVFGALLRPNADPKWPRITLEVSAKNYTGDNVKCPKDGYVVFRNSELMLGNIDKNVVGGSKQGLFYSLIRDYGVEWSGIVMNRLAKLSGRWLADRGMSIGIDDVQPSEKLVQLKAKLVDQGNKDIKQFISQWHQGRLETLPGHSLEDTLESKCQVTLSKIRSDAAKHCLNELNPHFNAPLIMATCGSKGSDLNISQMISCVGQQAINGKRIANGFVQRTLPHFPKGSREPDAKGFVENSFFSGMTATEFFMHTMAGREGLVDTAVKTAETGYMQRRLMKALEDLCVQYDGTVRASDKGIVQLVYGDDGLDPLWMADGIRPAKIPHCWEQAQATVRETRHPLLTPSKLQEMMQEIRGPLFVSTSEMFKADVHSFLSGILDKLRQTYAAHGITESSSVKEHKQLVNLLMRITFEQVREFYKLCLIQFRKAVIEPGTAVGAIAAQSIGEPGTQMTLKTFHFAGLASMNVTMGVPRIKEIINASKSIASPLTTCTLETDTLEFARIVKGRLETTKLGDIAEYIEVVYSPQRAFLEIRLDLNAINTLQLNVSATSVVKALAMDKKLKLGNNVQRVGSATVQVTPPDPRRVKSSSTSKKTPDTMMQVIAALRTALPEVRVSGIPTVRRAVIEEKKEGGKKTYLLHAEGTDLKEIMSVLGVKGTEVKCNDIIDVADTLGIEAARATIINEINNTMKSHGLTLDPRHMALLGDVMSYKGQILGITRFGVSKMKDSVLMLASFEQTVDHLFDAALHGYSDSIDGVSERIIMGMHIPVGTGLFGLLQKIEQPPPKPQRKLLFDLSAKRVHMPPPHQLGSPRAAAR